MRVEPRPTEIIPEQPEVKLTRGEELLKHGMSFTEELSSALQDGKITLIEGAGLAMSLIMALAAVFSKKED
jgi:hypothetical protein